LTLRGRNIAALTAGAATGADLYRGALQGGAQACGVAGGIAAGLPADLVALDSGHPGLIGRSGDSLFDSLVFGQSAGMIESVWRAGRKVVSQGRHHARDAIIARYRKSLSALLT
jgi:cytosine/adenosine deaminase-related metal-dependent hydrolase